MRTPGLIVLTGLVLSLAACATVENPVGPPPVPVPAGAPTPVADHDWFYHRDGEMARLAYGLAESDDLRLGLDCDRGSGRLTLSATGEQGTKPEIRLEAGGETGLFPARSEPSELHEGIFLTAETMTDAPVFQQFRRIGWIALWQDGERSAYAAHPESGSGIERFFAFCG